MLQVKQVHSLWSDYLVPYCWLVALSTSSIKYVYLPSAAVPVPTLPRPMLSVMDVDIPLCVRLVFYTQ